METEREPDHTDDPREQDTGSGGYPESNPRETAPREGTDPGAERAGGGDTGGAPSTSTPDEAEREGTTGNPGAAG